jgi:hypothetical protein
VGNGSAISIVNSPPAIPIGDGISYGSKEVMVILYLSESEGDARPTI